MSTSTLLLAAAWSRRRQRRQFPALLLLLCASAQAAAGGRAPIGLVAERCAARNGRRAAATFAVRALFVALALALWPARASADPLADATAALEQGIERYQAGELEQARAAFVRARDLAPHKPNPHRWVGLVAARAGRCAEALDELGRFLDRVGPDDPRRAEAAAARARCAPAPSKGGTLIVDSSPPGAEILIDDRAVGSTPYGAALAAGRHQLQLRLAGFAPAAATVDVREAEKSTVTVALRAAGAAATPPAQPARLRVESRTPGALVFLDGAPLGAAPLERSAPAGAHVVSVRKPGFAEWSQEIDVPPALLSTINVELQRAGAIRVEADVQGAGVQIDGRIVGNAPITVDVAPGRRIVEVTAPGRLVARFPVFIAAGERFDLQAKLAPAPPRSRILETLN